MNNYVLYCLKCKGPASTNLVIKSSVPHPIMFLEITCACNRENVLYPIGDFQRSISMGYEIKEKS